MGSGERGSVLFDTRLGLGGVFHEYLEITMLLPRSDSPLEDNLSVAKEINRNPPETFAPEVTETLLFRNSFAGKAVGAGEADMIARKPVA